jgi:hypothetical protein
MANYLYSTFVLYLPPSSICLSNTQLKQHMALPCAGAVWRSKLPAMMASTKQQAGDSLF